jgi:succinate-acetate transporter protein
VIFFGGILMWIAGLLEFILGNTFPFLVFTTYGTSGFHARRNGVSEMGMMRAGS